MYEENSLERLHRYTKKIATCAVTYIVYNLNIGCMLRDTLYSYCNVYNDNLISGIYVPGIGSIHILHFRNKECCLRDRVFNSDAFIAYYWCPCVQRTLQFGDEVKRVVMDNINIPSFPIFDVETEKSTIGPRLDRVGRSS